MHVLQMYRRGFFPMAEPAAAASEGESGSGGGASQASLNWYYPLRRGIIPLDERFHLSHSLKRTLKRGVYAVSFDEDFDAVLAACARRPMTWINEEYMDFYRELHRLGLAHSVEARLGGELVGGLYGLCMGSIFIGESMFHRAPDASKVCMAKLVERLKQQSFSYIDTQIVNSFTQTFGAYEVPHREYMVMMKNALRRHCHFHPEDELGVEPQVELEGEGGKTSPEGMGDE